jgi:hypothetical protein
MATERKKIKLATDTLKLFERFLRGMKYGGQFNNWKIVAEALEMVEDDDPRTRHCELCDAEFLFPRISAKMGPYAFYCPSCGKEWRPNVHEMFRESLKGD